MMTEKTTEVSRRYSPLKFTKSKAERLEQYSPCQAISRGVSSPLYYCHYSNAVYMGGTEGFKRNGRGIMLLDSGACAITNYSHDNMLGFNVVFRDGSLTLITVRPNRSKYVTFRSGPFLITMNYNQRGLLEKAGYFVDFKERKIFRLAFYHSKVDKKQEVVNRALLERTFDQEDYSGVIDDANHINMLDFNAQFPDGIECRQSGNRFKVGFVKRNEDAPEPNGLSFEVEVDRNVESFDVALRKRGYIVGDKLNRFGEKHFENGNYYMGGFKNGLFHSYGVLIHPREDKWVYGVYQKGQMVDLVASSAGNEKTKLSEVLRKIHEYEDTYIRDHIKLDPSAQELAETLKLVVGAERSPSSIEDPAELQHVTANNYRTIVDDFVSGQYEQNTEELIKEELSKERKNSFRKFVQDLPARQSPPPRQAREKKTLASKSKSKSRTKIKNKISNESIEKYEIKILSPDKKVKQKIKLRESGKKGQRKGETMKDLKVQIEEEIKHLKTAESSHRSPIHGGVEPSLEADSWMKFSALEERISSLRRATPFQSLGYLEASHLMYRDPYLTYPILRVEDPLLADLGLHHEDGERNYLSRRRHFKYLEEDEERGDLYLGRRTDYRFGREDMY